jgi:hypothetical protein
LLVMLVSTTSIVHLSNSFIQSRLFAVLPAPHTMYSQKRIVTKWYVHTLQRNAKNIYSWPRTRIPWLGCCFFSPPQCDKAEQFIYPQRPHLMHVKWTCEQAMVSNIYIDQHPKRSRLGRKQTHACYVVLLIRTTYMLLEHCCQ